CSVASSTQVTRVSVSPTGSAEPARATVAAEGTMRFWLTGVVMDKRGPSTEGTPHRCAMSQSWITGLTTRLRPAESQELRAARGRQSHGLLGAVIADSG